MSRYAVPDDLSSLGLPAAATAGIDPKRLQDAMDAASDLADGYLRSRFTLPIVGATKDLKRAVCAIAAFDVLTTNGFNPEQGSDIAIRLRYQDAMKWLKQVSDGETTPALVDSSPGAGTDDSPRAPEVISNCRRGW